MMVTIMIRSFDRAKGALCPTCHWSSDKQQYKHMIMMIPIIMIITLLSINNKQ